MGGSNARRRWDLWESFQLYRPRPADPAGSSAAADSRYCQYRAQNAFWRVWQTVFADRPRVDPTRTADAGDATASILFDPLGAPIGRADRHRPAVLLVCRARHRGCGVGRHDVQHEPRPAARWRAGGQVSRRRVVAASGQAAAVERPLLGRRDIVWRLGPAPRAFSQKTARADRPIRGAMASATFVASAAATTRMPRPPIPMPGSFARDPAKKRGCVLWAMR